MKKQERLWLLILQPGEKGILQLKLPADWKDYDVLYVTVKDEMAGNIHLEFSYKQSRKHLAKDYSR